MGRQQERKIGASISGSWPRASLLCGCFVDRQKGQKRSQLGREWAGCQLGRPLCHVYAAGCLSHLPGEEAADRELCSRHQRRSEGSRSVQRRVGVVLQVSAREPAGGLFVGALKEEDSLDDNILCLTGRRKVLRVGNLTLRTTDLRFISSIMQPSSAGDHASLLLL